jgi:TPR repeat protein
MLVAGASIAAEPVDIEANFKRGEAAWVAGDIVGAMEALKPAADAGHAGAQALYGRSLDEADNDAEAAEYYRKSAAQGNADGMYGLASLYISGDLGERRPDKAMELFKQAAALEHAPSVIAVAVNYATGSIYPEQRNLDSAETWNWIKKAAALEHLDSMALLENALRTGNRFITIDIASADTLRSRLMKLQGIDPNAKKKRQRR